MSRLSPAVRGRRKEFAMRTKFGKAVVVAAIMAAFAVAAGPAQADGTSMSLVLGTSPTTSAIQSYSWGFNAQPPCGGCSTSGKLAFGDFKLTKQVDANSLRLFEALGRITQFDTVTVQFTNSPFIVTYKLGDVMVKSVEQDATTANARPTEQVTLAFDSMKETVGAPLTGTSFGWDQVANLPA
jgi:type VI protein secretion system component Hcp